GGARRGVAADRSRARAPGAPRRPLRTLATPVDARKRGRAQRGCPLPARTQLEKRRAFVVNRARAHSRAGAALSWRKSAMGFHHTAFATLDLAATDRFYREVMGFDLAKVVAAPAPEGGWAKHVFYEITPDEYIAFWELHLTGLPAKWSPAISVGQ